MVTTARPHLFFILWRPTSEGVQRSVTVNWGAHSANSSVSTSVRSNINMRQSPGRGARLQSWWDGRSNVPPPPSRDRPRPR